MKIIQNSVAVLFLVLGTINRTSAQTEDMEAVKTEIQATALREQQAFKSGDCTTVLNLMESDITFLANGRRVPSKGVVGKFCNSIPRPFKKPTMDTLQIYPLSSDTGYAIRTLEYPKDEKTKMKEFVTKIWRKTNGEWKISHLHSTVRELPIE
ncbi:SnoaL-like domain-containing protein [Flavobacteriaceae bacterium TP-CH-4]|uniref:SnoaL-like domain-containing protein n=1 Tax=Pelagihabitans pacificus TaxID=2696054 RepID=A0A967E6T3_9FLAO|nr:nuclear transport factor 2 family protein [Pelagihabitans pacificus]NHF60857.1 SnoaL-like domain-containing protein [Pelagihabitans pacificus]